MKSNVHGTATGRFSGKLPTNSNTPKANKLRTGEVPRLMEWTEEYVGGFELEGAHLGPRTKWTHPYNYDPLLVHKTGIEPNGSVYSDRLMQWYPYTEVRAKMRVHFGDESDYYSNRRPKAIEAFLRDVLSQPTLKLTRIEEHCNQSSGYPVWFFAYQVAVAG